MALSVLGAPKLAQAAPAPATAKQLSVDFGVRYGYSLESDGYNPWRLGYGGGIGYTLKNALYLGGTFDYYVGEAHPPPAKVVAGNYYSGLAQIGYDYRLSKRWVLRPRVGIGWATLTFEGCIQYIGKRIDCTRTISSDTALVPGLQLMFVSPVNISIEARYTVLMNGEVIKDAAQAGLNLGFSF